MTPFETLQKLALALPETSERLCWGTPAFYVKNKLFARLREDLSSLAIKAPDLERLALTQLEPQIFSIPPHYVRSDMFVVNLEAVKTQELERLIIQAWKQVAPKRLLAHFEKENL